MTSPGLLTTLAQIISSQAQALEKAYADKGHSIPSLDEPTRPSPLDIDPTIAQTKQLLVAAAAQVLATVRSPAETLQEYSVGSFTAALLAFTDDIHLTNILSEGGPNGLHVKEISAKTGVDPSYLARVLRFLATRHVFKEVAPNVFTNNRISSAMMKPKSVEAIKADPIARFDDAPIACFVSGLGDESLKTSAFLSSFLQNPDIGPAAFNVALNSPTKLWEWYEQPGNEWRSRRFAAGMKGNIEMFPSEIYTKAIDGNSLKPDDVVVDVGGSVGSATLVLLKAFPKLRYVVQDLEKQIVAAEEFWREHAPDAVSSGRVQLQVHDFFNPQHVKDAAVYFLRVVIHDWPDKDAKKILANLRAAASSSSKLVLFDTLARYTCEPALAFTGQPIQAPSPLLPNLGIAGMGFNTALDIHMLALYNGKERTEAEIRELGQETGWKLETVVPGPLTTFIFSAI